MSGSPIARGTLTQYEILDWPEQAKRNGLSMTLKIRSVVRCQAEAVTRISASELTKGLKGIQGSPPDA